MKIVFVGGIEKEVHVDVALAIQKQLEKGCGNFQIFYGSERGELIMIVNLSQVLYIG